MEKIELVSLKRNPSVFTLYFTSVFTLCVIDNDERVVILHLYTIDRFLYKSQRSEVERLMISLSPTRLVPVSHSRRRMWYRRVGIVVRRHVMIGILGRHHLTSGSRRHQLTSGWRVSVEATSTITVGSTADAADGSGWSDRRWRIGTTEVRKSVNYDGSGLNGSSRRWRHRTARRRRTSSWAASRRLHGEKMDRWLSVNGSWRRKGKGVSHHYRCTWRRCVRAAPGIASMRWHAVESFGEVSGTLQNGFLQAQLSILNNNWLTVFPPRSE
jgi:hypothetical protein